MLIHFLYSDLLYSSKLREKYFLNFLFKMSRELCACFVDDDCVLLYIKQARVIDSMLYKDKTEHCLINRGAHLSLNIL